MKTKKLLAILGKQFPKSIATKYNDYVGLMTGKLPEEVNKILLCLDLDEEIYDIVKKEKPDLILTHHPFIYGKKSEVFKWDKKKEKFCHKIDALKIPVISYHTNFDEGRGGMNDALASALNLTKIHPGKADPMMRIGKLENPMKVEEFALFAKKALKVDYGLLIAKGKPMVQTVGIVGGAGSGGWWNAREEKCDIFVSGDVPHHIRRSIVTSNFNYLDLPHEIEKIYIPTMAKILKDIDKTLNIVKVDHEKLPKVIL